MKKHLDEEEPVLSHKSMRSLKQAGITAVFTGQTINVCASLNIEKVNMKSQFTLYVLYYLSGIIVLTS